MVARETNLVNAFETTLAAQLASGGTSINLTDDPGVDAPVYLVIDPDNDSNREVVLWSTGTNHAAATVTRDIDSKHGTDPTHASGTKVRLAVVKQHIEEAHDAIQQGFILEDGDGTEVTIAPAVASGVYTQREVKFVEGGGIDINWTDTDNGTDADPYDLTFTVNVDTAEIAADAVTGAKIADDAIDSEHYTDGSIDTAHIADGQVTTAKIAAASLVTESETITSNDNDTTIPTSAAVKNYADSEAATLTNKTLQDYAETDVAVSYGTDLSIDLANGNTGSVTLTGNVSGGIDFTNVPTNGTSTFTLKITQDGTGSRTLDIDEITVNGGSHVTGLTPGNEGVTLTTSANAVDLVTFLFFDAGTPLINTLLDFKNS